MKCITQIPVTPSDIAATRSQPLRVEPLLARARLVQRKARNEPRKDMRYARAGVSKP
jgi:hypothetical protein